MLTTVQQRYIPNRVLLTVEEAGSGDAIGPPLGGKVPLDGHPTAYVCQRQTCSPPATEAQQLEALL
jgi:uncharacterized protein YyaL (SSP411 family)